MNQELSFFFFFFFFFFLHKFNSSAQIFNIHIHAVLIFQKPAEEKYSVGLWLLALFIFVVSGIGKYI